jgi:hypothetical protein
LTRRSIKKSFLSLIDLYELLDTKESMNYELWGEAPDLSSKLLSEIFCSYKLLYLSAINDYIIFLKVLYNEKSAKVDNILNLSDSV